jgi:hypothetical protein
MNRHDPQNLIIRLMLATLFSHELDAIRQFEWRLLYVLRDLNEPQAQTWFIALHVPLFWALIAWTHHANVSLQGFARIALSTFCMLHAVLHWRLRDDPSSSFNSALSVSLIVASAGLGLLYLLLPRKRDVCTNVDYKKTAP